MKNPWNDKDFTKGDPSTDKSHPANSKSGSLSASPEYVKKIVKKTVKEETEKAKQEEGYEEKAVTWKKLKQNRVVGLRVSDSPLFKRIRTNIPTGTSPLKVESTTVNTNLNADLVDGYHHNQSLLTTAGPTFNHIHATTGFKIGVLGGLVPEGTIVAWNPGYYTDSTNGGYTFALGTANTVAAANAYLNASGWYVCNGATLNLSTSTLYNGSGRYLPRANDDRFLMGDTVAGTAGGSNTMAHTHNWSDTSAAESSHTHGVGSYSSADHTHAKGTIAAAGEATHTHSFSDTSSSEASHTHSVNPASTTSGAPSTTTSKFQFDSGGMAAAGSGHTHDTDIASFTSGAGSSHSHTVSGTSGADSSHTHTISGSTASDGGAAITGISGAGSSHTHSVSGTTTAASNDENRPEYLSVFYIIYVFAT